MINKQQFSHYLPKDFDQFDCVKISPLFYLILLFVLRGYIVWLMSITNFKDRVGVIEWVYPDPLLFYTSLLSGAIGVIVLLVMSLRRPDAANWVKVCWRHIRTLLTIALCFDWLITVGAYFSDIIYQLSLVFIHGVIVMIAVVVLYSSQRININVNEFPEKLPEK